MVGRAGEGEPVGIDQAPGGPLVDMVDFAPIAGNVAAGVGAAAVLRMNVQLMRFFRFLSRTAPVDATLQQPWNCRPISWAAIRPSFALCGHLNAGRSTHPVA